MIQPADQKPQQGFTKYLNLIFDKALAFPFKPTEYKVFNACVRYTDGFNQNERELSARFISKVTGIKYQHVSTAINSLTAKNILILHQSETHTTGRIISVNKNIEQWIPDLTHDGESHEIRDCRVTEFVTEPVTKFVTNKEIKENSKEIYVRLETEFEKFWDMYGKKRNRAACWEQWKMLITYVPLFKTKPASAL